MSENPILQGQEDSVPMQVQEGVLAGAGRSLAGKHETKTPSSQHSRGSVAVLLPRFSLYGGVEQFGYRFARMMAERGYHVEFICARQEIEAPEGVTIVETGRPRFSKYRKMLAFAERSKKICQERYYDCVVSLGKTVVQDVLRVGGCPLKSFWELSARAYPMGFARFWKAFRRHTNTANTLTRWIEGMQYSSGCRIVAVSHFVKDIILKAYPNLKDDDITVIYNRPDLERFHIPSRDERVAARRRFNVPDEVLAIGLATSNFALKGTGPLIKSLIKLPDHCHLYIAGGRGHRQYDRLAAKLGVRNRVHFLGKVDDMPAFFHALDMFALPSFYDACSNAVLEALASGLPTFSSETNGSSFFLPPEQVVKNPGSARELNEAVTRLLPRAETIRQGGQRTPFAWPQDMLSGVDSFADYVEAFVAERQSA